MRVNTFASVLINAMIKDERRGYCKSLEDRIEVLQG
jgi:hypothetical protein